MCQVPMGSTLVAGSALAEESGLVTESALSGSPFIVESGLRLPYSQRSVARRVRGDPSSHPHPDVHISQIVPLGATIQAFSAVKVKRTPGSSKYRHTKQKRYSSDLFGSQWETRKALLPNRPAPPTRPAARYFRRDFLNFRVVKTGCQWRILPGEFAPWRAAHYYFD
ncbi:transposase [Salinibacter ruber]|uniref:transposase n=1 Tax=Salinibacter ruber TaxID=146919 RepID=UPI003C6E06CE